MTFENWLGIAGGIALFLFGIKVMGGGIERLAGAKLKTILEKLTKNRFLGLLVGLAASGENGSGFKVFDKLVYSIVRVEPFIG